MTFDLYVTKGSNFTPSALMKRYSDLNPQFRFYTDRYFATYLESDGTTYGFNHWKIEDAGDFERVTVYLDVIQSKEEKAMWERFMEVCKK